MIKKISSTIKIILTTIWIISITVGLGGYLVYPELFTVEILSAFFLSFGEYFLIVYLIVSILRGFTLIPSTPFVLAGIVLFPTNLLKVYIISMIGILLSATILYFFSREMDLERMLLGKHQKLMKRAEGYIEKYGFWTVLIWSFVIIVPTDIICYITGSLKMNYYKFITAVLVGEGLICILLVWGGESLFGYIKNLI